MDKPRWTEGEWRAFYKHKYDEWHVSVPITDSNLRLGLFPDGIQSENPEHDAKLIAAAPALAEAAEPFVRELDGQLEAEPDDLPISVYNLMLTVGDLRALAAAYRKALGET